jgi:hypothetical protein
LYTLKVYKNIALEILTETYGVLSEVRTGSLFKLYIFFDFLAFHEELRLATCEAWRTTNQITRRLQIVVNKCLRRIMKIKWTDKITNEDYGESPNRSQ